jgi:peptide/nickel transport system substrate-binding protein
MKRYALPLAAALLSSSSLTAFAQGEKVPPVDFLTWPAAKYQHYYETSSYIAEGWRELGLEVNLNPEPFPNPMLGKWFSEHDFDVVMSVLSGAPYRMEPDFFTNAQFNSAHSAPGDWNVGEFADERVDELGKKQLAIYNADTRRDVILELQEVLYDLQPEAVIGSAISTTAINTDNLEIPGYVPAPDGLRSIWNQLEMVSLTGQAVKMGQTIDQASFNPLAANIAEDFNNLSLIYDRLIELGPDGKPRNRLASNIIVVDETTIDVTLREGHTFSDGEPLTAEDVKFSFDYFKEWEAAYYKKYLERLDEVIIQDDGTIRFKLTEAYAPFILHTLGQVFIVPEHVWGSVIEDTGISKPQEFRNTNPVGSGPYSLNYWKEGQEIYFTRRADHFMKPKSDLLFVIFGSAEVVGAALKKGDIDVSLQPLVPTVVDEFEAQENLKIFRTYPNGYMSARYKASGEIFKHKALRQAATAAIPYEKIVDEVLGGDATRSASSIVPINAFWHNDSLPLPEYDIEKAKQILVDAGFTWDENGALHFPE